MLLVVPLALRRLERPLALPPLLARERGRLMRLVLGPRLYSPGIAYLVNCSRYGSAAAGGRTEVRRQPEPRS